MTPDPNTAVLDDELEEDDLDIETDDDTPLVKKLRKEARDGRKARKERDDLKAELAKRDETDALALLEKDLGSKLTERQRSALLKEHEGDMTAKALRETAVALGWAEPAAAEPPDDMSDEEAEAHERTVGAMNETRTPTTGGVLDKTTVADWPADKWLRFKREHPDAADTILRGGTVKGLAY